MLKNGLAVIAQNARRHGCPQCKISAEQGRKNWRQICLWEKIFPHLDTLLEQGRLGRYLRDCAKIFLVDPATGWRCLRRIFQRKRQTLAALRSGRTS